MHSLHYIASLSALAALAHAQAGRFPCSQITNGKTEILGNACKALTATPNAPGVDTNGDKGEGFTPVGAACHLDSFSSVYFCGYIGATCDPTKTGDATQCDNGVCDALTSKCLGAFDDTCSGDDANCLGYLYCTNSDSNASPALTCGGVGAFCQVYEEVIDFNGGYSEAQQKSFDTNCAPGLYCSDNASGNCAAQAAVIGADCSDSPSSACASPLVCDSTTLKCKLGLSPSNGSRHRRAVDARRSTMCPEPYSACPLTGAQQGFECIDTQSNLEQCGNCAAHQGVDCSAIPGVDAVGCVEGVCEVWACAEGYAYDAVTNTCDGLLN